MGAKSGSKEEATLKPELRPSAFRQMLVYCIISPFPVPGILMGSLKALCLPIILNASFL